MSKNDMILQFLDRFVPLTHTIVKFNLSLKTNTLLPVVWVYASYVNRTHVNSLEGCYATTTPMMLRRFTIEEMNFRTFKHGFFLEHFLSVTSRKNQNNSLISGIIFSLTRLICSQLSKVVSNVQSFPEKKYSFTGRLSLCIVRESNPFQQFGRLLSYHYINDAEKVYDRRGEFQNFQTWFFPWTFSECHIKKKPK